MGRSILIDLMIHVSRGEIFFNFFKKRYNFLKQPGRVGSDHKRDTGQ